MATFKKPLTVGKVDTYTYTVPTSWLGDDTIISNVVTIDSKVTQNTSGIDANVLAVSLTGVESGTSIIHFDYTTSDGRTDCVNVNLRVTDDC